jgi:hypothetical protein
MGDVQVFVKDLPLELDPDDTVPFETALRRHFRAYQPVAIVGGLFHSAPVALLVVGSTEAYVKRIVQNMDGSYMSGARISVSIPAPPLLAHTAWRREHLEDALRHRAESLGSLTAEIDRLTKRQRQAESELGSRVRGGVPTFLTVASPLRITAASLRNELAPVLDAIQQIQETADAVVGIAHSGRVRSISQGSPIDISLSGLRDAVKLILELVIPWRRQHVRRMLELREEEARLENEKRRAQLLADRAGADLENAERALSLESKRLQLGKARLELAEQCLRVLDPENKLPTHERGVHVLKLVRAVDLVIDSELEFVPSEQRE